MTKAHDRDYWDRLHIEADKRKAVDLPGLARRGRVFVFSSCSRQRQERERDDA